MDPRGGMRSGAGSPRCPGPGPRRRFLPETGGSASIEFAILGLVFTMILCFIVEIGMSLLMQSTLDEAARTASRLIRTGTIQRAGGSPDPFQAALCAKVKLLMDCSQIRFNVVAGDLFTALPTAIRTDADDRLAGTSFVPGTAEQDVVVQVGYTRALYFPILRDVIGTHGKLLLVSTVVFQNEPY